MPVIRNHRLNAPWTRIRIAFTVRCTRIMQGSIMRVNAPPFRVSLQWDHPLTVTDGQGTCITARRGAVWITIDNDVRDVVLESGESFLLEKRERVIVQAIGKAEVVVAPPPAAPRRAPPALAQRLAVSIRRLFGQPAPAMG
jgi:hypothetical protein